MTIKNQFKNLTVLKKKKTIGRHVMEDRIKYKKIFLSF